VAGEEGRTARDMVLVAVGFAWWVDNECGDLGIQASMVLWIGRRVQKTCQCDERYPGAETSTAQSTRSKS
jgi:hypothetical protein